jgi:septal ring factor EnvC (AmiA/AmiB activator)
MSVESEGKRTRAWISAEIWIAMLVPLLGGAFAYGQLNADVSTNSASTQNLTQESKATNETVNTIKTDVAVIKTQINSINENVKSVAEQAKDNSKTLQEILRRLPDS